MLEKLSSVKIMSDASFATSVPVIPYKKRLKKDEISKTKT
jgi:hypothetical protein